MKKLKIAACALCGSIALGFISRGSFVTAADQPDAQIIYGDITGDGIVNAKDLVMLNDYILRKTTLSEDAFERADMNQDGYVDSFDMSFLRDKTADPGITLEVSQKKISTDSENVNVYFYADVFPEGVHVTLYNALTDEPIMEMVDDGRFSITGDDMMDDGVYSCKFDIDNSEAAVFYYYAKIEETGGQSNYSRITVYKPLSQQDYEDMSAVNTAVSELRSSEGFSEMTIDDKKAAMESLLSELREEGLVQSFTYSSSSESFQCVYKCGISFGVMLRELADTVNNF